MEEVRENKDEGMERIQEVSFILQFLEERPGAIAVTTCGTWDDIDAADNA